MNTKYWKLFSGLFAVILALTAIVTPAAMAQSPEDESGGSEGKRGHRGARLILTVAAEELDMTKEALVTKLREEEDRSIADVANEQGVSPETIVEAIMVKISKKLDGAVDAGKISQEEADERLENVQEKVTKAVNNPFPAKKGVRGKRAARDLFKVAAETIGLSPQELMEELRAEEDRSIADVANAKGVNPETVIEAMVDKAEEKLNERVDEGKITQEEAKERLETVREKVTEVVNLPFPQKGERPDRGQVDNQ